MQSQEVQLLNIAIGIMLILALISLFLLYFSLYKKRTHSDLEKLKIQLKFQTELSKVSMEIKEEILHKFSKELHDNVGQVLSVATMHLNLQIEDKEDTEKENLIAVKQLVEKSLNDIRTISKLVRGEVKEKVDFKYLLKEDLKRIQDLKKIHCNFNFIGENYEISNEHQLIIYRMIQESINNVLQHSQSEKIDININNTEEFCNITVKDYGRGFKVESKNISGLGLNRIKSRANLISAMFNIQSVLDKGTIVTIRYPYLKS